jgi:DNA-binding XRE family transcriptional regulator
MIEIGIAKNPPDGVGHPSLPHPATESETPSDLLVSAAGQDIFALVADSRDGWSLVAMPAPVSDALAEFGARVRARRQELQLSQEGLADRSGLHWTFVGQVERGRRNLSLHNLLKLAEALDIDPADLVTGLAPPD